MGMFDDIMGDPYRRSQLSGALLGISKAASDPYSNIGSIFAGAGQGAMDARQQYTQDEFQNLRLQQMRSTLEQDTAKRAALNNLFKGFGQQQSPPAALQPTAAPTPSTMDNGSQVMMQPQAQAVPQQASAPQFHLPAGFDSPEQFQDYAQIDPEGAMKRMFAAPEKPMTVSPGSHLIDPQTGREIYAAPEKPNPNQPFNSDGTPNAAYQAYERQKMQQQQAPAWANVAIARGKADRAAKGLIEPDTLTFMAQQVLAGDKSPFTNIGRGAQGAENLAALRTEVQRQAQGRGLGGADLAALNAEFGGLQAGERTLGNRTANIEMAASEAQSLMPLALQASAKVNRTQYPSLNKVILAAQQGTGDENVVRLGVAVNGLVNTYARAISPTGAPTVSDKDHAREILDKAWSQGQLGAAIGQMNQEIQAARKSPGSVRGEFRHAISGRSGDAAFPEAASTPKSQMLARPKSPADAMKLPAGTHFLDGNGVERVR